MDDLEKKAAADRTELAVYARELTKSHIAELRTILKEWISQTTTMIRDLAATATVLETKIRELASQFKERETHSRAEQRRVLATG